MSRFLFAFVFLLPSFASGEAAQPLGYYRQPTLHKDTIVFVAEGDLWKVASTGGTAARLTTHASEEELPALSPDGQSIAFVGHYEGPGDVYTMPLAGGPPRRLTWDAAAISFVGWTPDGKVLVSTNADADRPAQQLLTLELAKDGVIRRRIPLAQAADGCFSADGKTLFFTRFPFQGSHTKRYQGGTAQNLWSFTEGSDEARPLTANFKGTSKNPMCWRERVYFVSDRDGTMNLWSMKPDASDLRQHTKHKGWDVASPALSDGRIVYQLGADLRLYDIEADTDRLVPIHLDSDFDQTRERWLKNPAEYLTSAHLSPDGDRVVLTARGRVFVAPARQGRLVEAGRHDGVRHRDARFLPDGQSLLSLADESGEVELWKLPANGVGRNHQLTSDADVLRWEAIPSPDGKFIAHHDKNQRLFLYDVEKKESKQIDESKADDFADLAWSPDSAWLAYAVVGENLFRRIKLHHVAEGRNTFVTTSRYDSFSPTWSGDGKFLYFLSDRNLRSVVTSPWGTYQPEPFFDQKTKLYQLALAPGLRSPFAPPDELNPPDKKELAKKEPAHVVLEGIEARLQTLPVPAGNYTKLSANDKALFWLAAKREDAGKGQEDVYALMGLQIGNDNPEPKVIADRIRVYELSGDGKKLLVRKGDNLFVIDAVAAPAADMDKRKVDLSSWSMSVVPREEWRQMFAEAWRMERDYFYDRSMHGVDWKLVRKKYEPLVDRVSTRTELADLMAQMVSELSALHIFVRPGDTRKGEENAWPALLGARLARDHQAGGYRVEHVYQSDPDEPELTSPLARPDVAVKVGDVIEMVNGMATLSVPEIGYLLRRKAGQQVLLRIKPPDAGKSRDVIVHPLTPGAAENLRYHEWEYTRRLAVEDKGKGEIGYVHLRAMGGGNFTEWAKGFYPVFTRKGLIIDVRHNRGGNIDSWILGRLLRKAWFHWSQRVGQQPVWNMQFAFRGHIVVLCDAFTASDGEAFCEGIKRLGLGTVIGTRTWGGEIWLNGNNFLRDRGIATSAEFGVYGPEGTWLIEGHGVDPDVVVDNLPHASFKGHDAQLEAALKHLREQIKARPVEVPPPPKPPRPGLEK